VLGHAQESAAQRTAADIELIPGAVVHASAGGKLVVTLEASDPAAIVERIADIQRMPGVLSAALVSEHSEPLDKIDEEIDQ
jgi:periplasmic nitrate reductase NapD